LMRTKVTFDVTRPAILKMTQDISNEKQAAKFRTKR
jgi:hypothetical protein